MITFKKTGAGLDKKRINQLEVTLGSVLPDDYRSFLRRCNGGHRPIPDMLEYAGLDNVRCLTPFGRSIL
ncbi:SMI1/KNR4 family protein [Xanthomonas cerealis]|uniref:SMI1/KNR4 family protein n=1 Tax=Xanthomonas cerealis TaxID=3390025 RepID=UPI000B00A6C9|nr:SMI1/KNR4 family protein [Xanthomonas translucens]UKE46261.1 SMI1/KNR4 family protein [Xanthomonas translucens pv. cerealis]